MVNIVYDGDYTSDIRKNISVICHYRNMKVIQS